MNIAIAFLVGCITFVLMMILKIPIKWLTAYVADKMKPDVEEGYILYKRLNTAIIFLTIIVATIGYYFVFGLIGIGHFKLCCSLKAGVIAVALYAVFEQWFGDDFDLF